jgi:hypothetical protein
MAPAQRGVHVVGAAQVVQNPLGSGAAGGVVVAAAAAALPPLPSGWEEHRDDYDVWYVGPNGETQWDRPEAPARLPGSGV